jgi:hypothetical protein
MRQNACRGGCSAVYTFFSLVNKADRLARQGFSPIKNFYSKNTYEKGGEEMCRNMRQPDRTKRNYREESVYDIIIGTGQKAE